MKTNRLLILLVFAAFSILPIAETKAQDVSVNFSMFQQELSPYGRWMNNPSYGQVWVYNDPNFRPYYSDGHWEYTNYGWSWVSDYDWGWAPFHYGRWEQDPYNGWMWIPGYEWASAWVSWSSYDDYYGWAPLGYGIGINVSFGNIPYNNWTFVPRRNICERDINRYYVAPQRNYGFRNAVVINNYYNGRGGVGRYVRGPERREVERYTNNRVQERRINYNDRPARRDDRAINRNDGRRPSGDAANNSNDNRRRNDANQNGNAGNRPDVNNRRDQNNADNRNRRVDDAGNNNNPQNGNNPRRRNDNGNAGNNNGNPPVRNDRIPVPDATPRPQDNNANNPGRRQNDNRINGNNGQQNNLPQRQPQADRPQRQQQMERPSQPQQQQRPPDMRQQRQPDVQQQRTMQRGSDAGSGGGNIQRSNDNNQSGNSGNRRGRNG